jgi:hypothetical protein
MRKNASRFIPKIPNPESRLLTLIRDQRVAATRRDAEHLERRTLKRSYRHPGSPVVWMPDCARRRRPERGGLRAQNGRFLFARGARPRGGLLGGSRNP